MINSCYVIWAQTNLNKSNILKVIEIQEKIVIDMNISFTFKQKQGIFKL